MRNITRISEVPGYIRAAMTPEEVEFYEQVYDRPRLGPEWVIAHRKMEMTLAELEERCFYLEYFPDKALNILEGFKTNHYDCAPDRGLYGWSTMVNRIKVHYPNLFKHLDTRIAPIQNALDTHPYLRNYWENYVALRKRYWEMLSAAENLAASEPKATRNESRHRDYRRAFAAIYLPLHALLTELAATTRRNQVMD